jgi:hypothetical protein
MIIDSVPDVGAYNTIEQYKQAYNICKQDPLATYVNEDMRSPYVFRIVAVHIGHIHDVTGQTGVSLPAGGSSPIGR